MKKLILPILLISVFLANLLILPGIAVAFFHDKGSELELDCYSTFVDAVKGSANWGDTAEGNFIYKSDPKTISKNQGENFCLLSKVQMFDESRIFDKHELKITYFPELPYLIDKFNELKSSEESDFEIRDNSENEYSGRTARGEPLREDVSNYARQVNILGNCLVEFTYRADRTPAMHDDMGFAKTLADAVLETVKTYQVPMLNYEKLQSFCGGKADNQQEEVPQSQQLQPSQTDKQKKQSQDGSPLNIFGVNPFQTWLNLSTLAELGSFINSGAGERFAETTILHMVGGEPIWEKEARELGEAKKFFDGATRRLAELEGKVGEADPSLTNARVRVETAKFNLLLKGGGALVELHPIDGQNGVLEKGQPPILKSGAVDVIVEPQDGQQFEIQTPNTEIFVIGTEFSVIYDQKRGQTLVAVYKGKVEVKTRDGKNTIVTPDGDKPGVVVVTQKLSPLKFALAGLVLVVIVGSIILIIRKKFTSIGFNKKKK